MTKNLGLVMGMFGFELQAGGIDWGTWTIFEPLLLSASYGLLGDGGDCKCGWLLEMGRLARNS